MENKSRKHTREEHGIGPHPDTRWETAADPCWQSEDWKATVCHVALQLQSREYLCVHMRNSPIHNDLERT